MATNLEISGSIRRTEEGNELWWYGGGGIGWESTLAACAGVPVGVRSGRTVGVIEDGKVVEYIWHPEDTSDDGLVLKTVQQTALDAKANLSGADFTGAISVANPTDDAHAVNKGYADATYAPIDSVHYRGTYATLAALQTAIPVGNPGDEALVDAGVGTDAVKYIWDDTDQDWVEGGGTGASSFADLSGQPGDNAALASALNGKEATANKSLSVSTDQASDVKYPSVKAVYDWAVGLFQTLSNKDATGGYAGLTLFKINFKNAANTFTSFFTNVNTAARTYTFPDKDGTVAMLDDVTGGGATLDTDGTFAANSDTVAPSQKAAKTYVDSKSVDVTVASGEKVLSVTSAGVQKTYDLTESVVDVTSLTAADFSTGSATVTGIPMQKAYDTNYEYTCVGVNTWKRTPLGLTTRDIYAGTIDDSGGLKTSTELSAAFPSIVTCQRVYGSAGIYEKKASNWVYFAHTTI